MNLLLQPTLNYKQRYLPAYQTRAAIKKVKSSLSKDSKISYFTRFDNRSTENWQDFPKPYDSGEDMSSQEKHFWETLN